MPANHHHRHSECPCRSPSFVDPADGRVVPVLALSLSQLFLINHVPSGLLLSLLRDPSHHLSCLLCRFFSLAFVLLLLDGLCWSDFDEWSDVLPVEQGSQLLLKSVRMWQNDRTRWDWELTGLSFERPVAPSEGLADEPEDRSLLLARLGLGDFVSLVF